jgi:hypothetical protein
MSSFPVTAIFRDDGGQAREMEFGDLYPDLTWEKRPDMVGSGASEELERVWVGTIMAFREIFGALIKGKCLTLNLAALPLVREVLGTPVETRTGFAMFSTGMGGSDFVEFGRRWMPDKWKRILTSGTPDAAKSMDFHSWLETSSHIIDLTTFQIAPAMRASNKSYPVKGREGTWPPMIYWAKRDLPTHPRDSYGDRKLLLHWSPKAIAWINSLPEDDRLVEAVTARSREITEALKCGERIEAAPSELSRALALHGIVPAKTG